jgi:uncharacterized protein YciI
MPLFAVHALDKPDALPRRLEHYTAHRNFIEAAQTLGVSVVISGPLQSDDGDTMIAPGRAEVEGFTAADPFMTEGVWGEVRIHRFHRRR